MALEFLTPRKSKGHKQRADLEMSIIHQGAIPWPRLTLSHDFAEALLWAANDRIDVGFDVEAGQGMIKFDEDGLFELKAFYASSLKRYTGHLYVNLPPVPGITTRRVPITSLAYRVENGTEVSPAAAISFEIPGLMLEAK